MKDFIKKRYKFILLFLCLNLALLTYNFIFERLDGSNKSNAFIFIVLSQLAVEFILIFLYAFLKKRGVKLEKIFLALIVPLGLLHIFITPLNFVPDEEGHIIRAYEISKGNVTPKTQDFLGAVGDLPIEVWQSFYYWQDDDAQYDRTFGDILKPESGETEHRQYGNTAGYSPIAYAPQILGLIVGRFLHLPIVLQFYLARIFALLTFAIICYFALKIMPKYKEFLLFIMLLPMSIQQAASFSVDSLLNASIFIFIALTMREIYGKTDKLTRKRLIPIIIFGALAAFIKKFAYLPLTLLFLLIPTEKFKNKKVKILSFFALLLAAYIGNKLFLPVASSTIASITSATSAGNNFNLYNFIVISLGTLLGIDPNYLVENAAGLKIGYGYVSTPTQIYIYLTIIFAIVLLIKNVEKYELKKYHRLVFWAIPLIIGALFYYTAFTQWKNFLDENRVVEGVTGRYFIGLLPLLPFMIEPKKPYLKEKLSSDYVFLFAIFINAVVLTSKLLFNT